VLPPRPRGWRRPLFRDRRRRAAARPPRPARPSPARQALSVSDSAVRSGFLTLFAHCRAPSQQPHQSWDDLADDASLSEDAHFIARLDGGRTTFIGVADGVGSWRTAGVDPRAYAHTLMARAEAHVREHALRGEKGGAGPPYEPYDALVGAWEATTAAEVVGSSTACIATLDHELNQARASIRFEFFDGELESNRASPAYTSSPSLRFLFRPTSSAFAWSPSHPASRRLPSRPPAAARDATRRTLRWSSSPLSRRHRLSFIFE
jgi:hypothetical protein